jgi:hypothetical protein
MKSTPRIATLVLLLIIQLTACQKKPVTPPPVEAEVCRITRMETNAGAVFFTYNSYGNPTRITLANPTTGKPHRAFLYDKYNRLTDYIGNYLVIPDSIQNFSDLSNSMLSFYFEFWYRYTYVDENPNSLPIGDTVRMGGGFRGTFGPIVASQRIETYMYDSQNRIVNGGAYNYDANGNLILPNVTYDDKKNYRQTNRIWMFIDRDYSKNNPFIATAYNSEGYPTVLPSQSFVPGRGNFIPYPLGINTMEYSCSTGQKAE